MLTPTIKSERLHKYIKFPKYTKEEELDYIKECVNNADLDKFEKYRIK